MSNSANMKAFKRRHSLSFAQRLEVLRRLNEGEKSVNLSKDFKVAKSTISGIKKNENEILRRQKILEESDCDLSFRKRYKGTEESELEKAVYQWYCEMREAGAPVTGPDLQTMAREINCTLDDNPNFKASSGWVRRFKARHNLRSLNLQDEKVPPDSQLVVDFKATFAGFMELKRIENLDYIYSCDETTLDWKLLPSIVKSDNPKGCKSKLTLMVCANASGTHKIPLFIVGQSKSPRCFENIDQLPVCYTYQSRARMNKEIFTDWYTNWFIPAVKEKHDCEDESLKIILLMDSAPFHPSAEELEELHPLCTIVCLPLNLAPLIQPLSQGIIEKLKRSYKCLFLKHLLREKATVGFDEALRAIQLTNCFGFCKEAWTNVSASLVRNCWETLVPLDDKTPIANRTEIAEYQYVQSLLSLLPGLNCITLEQTMEWLDCDSYEASFSCSEGKENDSPVSVVDERFEEVSSDENEEPVSILEAYNAINTIKRFVMQVAKDSSSNLKLFDDIERMTDIFCRDD